VASAPEVILDAAADPEPAAAFWSRWSSLPAVRTGRVVAMDAGLVTLPGPQLDRALRSRARAIQGDVAVPPAAPTESVR
jgi:ABC-type Fe3+-hydroxamate transport system substrate-binding protein